MSMNRTVYIVDDDPMLLEGMEIALREHDYTSVGFDTAKTFWKKINLDRPDAVVLDIGLEGENGDEIAKKLKSSRKFKQLPVILISAENELVQKAIDSHANSYLAKPFALEKLIHVLEESFSSRSE